MTAADATAVLYAKRNKRQQSRQDAEDLNRWYESVDADANPDDVFWEEMERQRLLSQVGDAISTDVPTIGTPYAATTSQTPTNVGMDSKGMTNPMATTKSVEATLSEYAAYAVSDNWLDEEKAVLFRESMEGEADMVKSLDEQLDEWESEEDEEEEDTAWMVSDDPWDHWQEDRHDLEEEERQRVKIDPKNKAAEFLFTGEEEDPQKQLEAEQEEAAYLQRLGNITIFSPKLERARNNPKAAAFFNREPDDLEGYDRLWVTAIDNVCFKNIVGTFRNYGVANLRIILVIS